ncbi:MAG: MBL fold metallo-hydrolase [Acidobacteriota bacterium]|nr:MBL fold metallo-hydrolase [Acidobacteriota bacterium]MDE3043916.1 MBL fold metallo-hydrolase [Acidobacteriota bacterium]MDE3223016.1 MBL fold metallo-hydrolase [Acidobacteriota bacterium]
MSSPYLRQFLAGRDFALDDSVAVGMRNFAYAVGDREAGVAVLVDPAYRPVELAELVEADGLRVVGALATHYHPDHVGGSLGGRTDVAGIAELLAWRDVPIHAQHDELTWITRRTDVGAEHLVGHDDGDVLRVGDVAVTLVHTPGHTPGSQCLLVEGSLISGDTLFIDGCGRTDLPGGDPEAMYDTLTRRLANVPGDTVLLPGHLYSPESSAPMTEVRGRNFVLAPQSREQWLAMFGS